MLILIKGFINCRNEMYSKGLYTINNTANCNKEVYVLYSDRYLISTSNKGDFNYDLF